MSCSGLHCAGCGAGASVPPVALAGLLGLAWVTEHLIEVAVVSAACAVLSAAAVIWLMRWQDRRQAAIAARGPLLITRPGYYIITAIPDRPGMPSPEGRQLCAGQQQKAAGAAAAQPGTVTPQVARGTTRKKAITAPNGRATTSTTSARTN